MVTFSLSSGESGNDKLRTSSRITRYRGLRCWSAGVSAFGWLALEGLAVATVSGAAWRVWAEVVSATLKRRIVSPIAHALIFLIIFTFAIGISPSWWLGAFLGVFTTWQNASWSHPSGYAVTNLRMILDYLFRFCSMELGLTLRTPFQMGPGSLPPGTGQFGLKSTDEWVPRKSPAYGLRCVRRGALRCRPVRHHEFARVDRLAGKDRGCTAHNSTEVPEGSQSGSRGWECLRRGRPRISARH